MNWWELPPGPEREAAKAADSHRTERLPWAHREPVEVMVNGRSALRWKSIYYFFSDDDTREIQRRLALAGQLPVAKNLRCEIRGQRIIAIGKFSGTEYPVGEMHERPALWRCYLAAAARQEYSSTRNSDDCI